MKFVVVDVCKNHTIAVDKTGRFHKLKTKSQYQVGYEYEVNNKYSFNTLRNIAAIAACFIIFGNLSYFGYCYYTPYSYIAIDVNPSIELSANRYGRIIKADAKNNDGTNVLSSLSVNNKTIKEGIEQILDYFSNNQYLQNSDSVLMVTVSGNEQNNVEDIESEIKAITDSKLSSSSSTVLFNTVSLEKHKTAESMNISTGKLLLIEEASKKDSTIQTSTLKSMPVNELIKIIKEHETDVIEQPKSTNQETQSELATEMPKQTADIEPPKPTPSVPTTSSKTAKKAETTTKRNSSTPPPTKVVSPTHIPQNDILTEIPKPKIEDNTHSQSTITDSEPQRSPNIVAQPEKSEGNKPSDAAQTPSNKGSEDKPSLPSTNTPKNEQTTEATPQQREKSDGIQDKKPDSGDVQGTSRTDKQTQVNRSGNNKER